MSYQAYHNVPVENSYTSLQRRSIGMNAADIPWQYLRPVCRPALGPDETYTNTERTYANTCPGLVDYSAHQLSVHSFPAITIPENTTALLLDFNELDTLPDEILNLPSLLYLSACSQSSPKRASITYWPQLKTIPDGISQLIYLKELVVHNNALEDLPISLSNLGHLRKIDLSLNYFRDFPVALCCMTGLEELVLSGNYIEELPPDIGAMARLKVLRIANNGLRVLPATIDKLQSLRHVSLRNNKLQELPPSMAALPVMRDLTGANEGILLSGNVLQYPPQRIVDRSIAEAVHYMTNNHPRPVTGCDFQYDKTAAKTFELEGYTGTDTVDLSSRNPPLEILQTDMPLFGRIPSQTCHLHASKNKIQAIDDSIGTLKSLKSLVLDNNCLVTLSTSLLNDLKSLELLSLRNQKHPNTHRSRGDVYLPMNQMPKHLYLCGNLKELYLDKNKICEIPEDIAHIRGLEVLDLIHNHIRSISSSLCANLTKLKYLGLSSNMISSLPDNIGDLQALEVLRMSGNKLVQLPDSICSIGSLMTLSLSHNQLVYLPAYFFKLIRFLPSNSGSYHNSHINRTFMSSLDLEGNEKTLIYPSPEICFRNGHVPVAEMFKYMQFISENPDLMKLEMERAQSHLPRKQSDYSRLSLPAGGSAPSILTDKVLLKLGSRIGKEWRILGMVLGLESHVLYQIQHNKTGDLQGTIVEMLRVWRNLNFGKKSESDLLHELMEALGKSEVGRGDIKSMLQG